ncbi:hypothetical protein AwPolaro_11370 [Polaromonas sp.]|nr:hypothetical protein AwPolaro_11370 [Polaromonas sp.]
MYALLIPLPLANEILGMTEADRLDRQMEALCKQDAGVKIFETVRVPATAFDTAERLIIGPFQTLDGGLSRRVVLNAYFIDSKTDTLKGRNSSSPGLMPKGRLSRYQTTIRRAADNKVLGEDVSYGRTGGDFTLNHPSQNHCPKPRSPYIVQSIFIKEM